jgi:hypothetical protein
LITAHFRGTKPFRGIQDVANKIANRIVGAFAFAIIAIATAVIVAIGVAHGAANITAKQEAGGISHFAGSATRQKASAAPWSGVGHLFIGQMYKYFAESNVFDLVKIDDAVVHTISNCFFLKRNPRGREVASHEMHVFFTGLILKIYFSCSFCFLRA